MDFHFSVFTVTRKNILESIQHLSLAQLNTIPAKFNNSIAWQVTHIVVTQQLLHYKLSKNTTAIDNSLIEKFKKGSDGNATLTTTEWEQVKVLLVNLPKQLEKDYNNKLFSDFSRYPTSYNVVLSSIEEAIIFNNIHEAMHFGTIAAMIKHL